MNKIISKISITISLALLMLISANLTFACDDDNPYEYNHAEGESRFFLIADNKKQGDTKILPHIVYDNQGKIIEKKFIERPGFQVGPYLLGKVGPRRYKDEIFYPPFIDEQKRKQKEFRTIIKDKSNNHILDVKYNISFEYGKALIPVIEGPWNFIRKLHVNLGNYKEPHLDEHPDSDFFQRDGMRVWYKMDETNKSAPSVDIYIWFMVVRKHNNICSSNPRKRFILKFLESRRIYPKNYICFTIYEKDIVINVSSNGEIKVKKESTESYQANWDYFKVKMRHFYGKYSLY